MAPRRLARLAGAALVIALVLPAGASAAAPYDPDTVLMKFRPGTPGAAERSALATTPGVGRTVGQIPSTGVNVVRVTSDPAVVARRLSRNPNVQFAHPDFVMRTSATPDDPLYAEEWGLHNTGQTGGTADADIDAPEGWDAAGLASFPATGGVRVGIIDTGLDQLHPEFAGKRAACATSFTAGTAIIPGVCTDDNGHGTHVAGTISANTNNGSGVAGVAFNSPLVICKALATPLGTGLTSDIANCLDWTSRQAGVKVISMSLGGGESATLKAAVDAAEARGVLMIAAAGNDGDATANYPAAYPEVMSVAATTHTDARAEFSNANADVEIAAPGQDIRSTYLGVTYNTLSGTSMATPHVSGVAALLFGRNAGATASQVRSTLTSSADDLGAAGRDPSFGFGRLNLCNAMGGGCSYTPGTP